MNADRERILNNVVTIIRVLSLGFVFILYGGMEMFWSYIELPDVVQNLLIMLGLVVYAFVGGRYLRYRTVRALLAVPGISAVFALLLGICDLYTLGPDYMNIGPDYMGIGLRVIMILVTVLMYADICWKKDARRWLLRAMKEVGNGGDVESVD